MKEKLISKALDADSIISAIEKYSENRSFVLYGLSDACKVLISRLKEKGVRPLYILDQNTGCTEYDNVHVLGLDRNEKHIKDSMVIVMVWNGFDMIKRKLVDLGYNEKIVFELGEL